MPLSIQPEILIRYYLDGQFYDAFSFPRWTRSIYRMHVRKLAAGFTCEISREAL